MDAKTFLNTQENTFTDWDTLRLTQLARANGYHFTAEELETAADELWGHLSEDQLRDMAGGGSVAPCKDGPVNVDKSNMDSKKSGQAWTPPPGDVSGNSCFFTRR